MQRHALACRAASSALTPGFQRYVAVLRIRFRIRFRKNRVRTAVPQTPLPYAVYHREGKWACRIVSNAAGPVGWPASFPRIRWVELQTSWLRQNGKIELDSI